MAVIINGDTGIDKITDGSVVAADIGAGEVGSTQLASTLDLSGKTVTLATDAAVVSKLSTASGSAPSYSARAWVNFQGTSTVTIRASGNVSSITDEGTGQYLVNFTTAMADADYSVTGSCNFNNGTGMTDFANGLVSSSACRVICHDIAGGTKYDPYAMNVAIFR